MCEVTNTTLAGVDLQIRKLVLTPNAVTVIEGGSATKKKKKKKEQTVRRGNYVFRY